MLQSANTALCHHIVPAATAGITSGSSSTMAATTIKPVDVKVRRRGMTYIPGIGMSGRPISITSSGLKAGFSRLSLGR